MGSLVNVQLGHPLVPGNVLEKSLLVSGFACGFSLLGKLSLAVFYSGLGGGCTVHVGSSDSISELSPQPKQGRKSAAGLLLQKKKGRKTHLLDSYSSCSDSGKTFFGATREVEGSKRTFFSLVSLSLNSIADDQWPLISPMSDLPGPTTLPEITL